MNYLIRLTVTFRILVNLFPFGEFFSLLFGFIFVKEWDKFNRRIALVGSSMSRVQNIRVCKTAQDKRDIQFLGEILVTWQKTSSRIFCLTRRYYYGSCFLFKVEIARAISRKLKRRETAFRYTRIFTKVIYDKIELIAIVPKYFALWK